MGAIRDFTVGILLKAKDEASGVFTAIASRASSLGSMLAGYLTGAFFGSAIDSAAEFEAQMDKVIVKTDDGKEHVDALTQAAEDMGAKYRVEPVKAAQALEVLGAAGLKSKDAIQALPGVLALAAAEGINFDRAAGLIIDSMSILGLGFEQTGRAADVLVKGANLSKTAATEMAEALKYAGGEANTAKMSLEQTTAVLDALAQKGFVGSQAGAMLRNILAELNNPTSEARRELAALGITTGNLNTVIDGFTKAGPAGERAIRAFGTEAGPAMRGLLAVGTQGIKEYEASLLKAGGAAGETAGAVSSNFRGASDAVAAAWDTVKRKLVEPLLEPITRQINDLTTALQTSANDGSLKSISEALKNTFELGAKWVREFIAEFDFKEALTATGEFVNNSVAYFEKIESVGSKAAAGLGVAWNGAASVFYAVAAGVLKAGESFNRAAAAVEERLNKVGLGSRAHAEELRRQADDFATRAVDMAEKGAAAHDAARASLDRLTTSTSANTAATQQAAQAARQTAEQLIAQAQGAATAEEKVVRLWDAYNKLVAAGAPLAEQTQVLEAIDAALTGTAEASQQAAQGQQAVAAAAKAANPALEEARQNVEALRLKYEALRESGTKDTQAVADALLAYQKAQRELTAQTQQDTGKIVAAYEQLGVRTSKELQELARQAIEQFEAIKKSGTASPGDIQRAFESMAAKVLEAGYAHSKAAGQQAEASLRAKTATEDQRKAVEDLAQQYHQASGRTDEHTQATNRYATAAQEAAEAGRQIDEALKAIEQGAKVSSQEIQALIDGLEKMGGTAENAARRSSLESARFSAELREQAQAHGELTSALINNWVARLKTWSDAAAAQFNATFLGIQNTTGAADDLNAALEANSQQILQIQANLAQGTDGFAGWANRMATAALGIEQAFLGQAKGVRSIIQEIDGLTRRTSLSNQEMQRLALLANTTTEQFGLLDQAQLDTLHDAIDTARQKLADVRQQAMDAKAALSDMADTLQNEIDQIAGNQEAIENRRFQSALERIRAQTAAAGEAGRQEAREAERLQNRLHELKLQQIRDEQRAKEQAQARPPAAGGTARPTAAGSSEGTGRAGEVLGTYRLELALPSGRVISTQISGADRDTLLGELENARSRTH